MPAFVHVNWRVLDAERQAALAPRFKALLEAAGGRVHHFGPVVEVLEGNIEPLPLAGVFEFPDLASAMSFYESKDYAPIKSERQLAQQATMFVVDAP